LRKINILPERKHYYFDNLGNIFFDKNSLYLSKFAYAEYNDFDYSVADFFLKKIDVFLDILNSSKIYLVFPNICVKHSDLEKWNNYLNDLASGYMAAFLSQEDTTYNDYLRFMETIRQIDERRRHPDNWFIDCLRRGNIPRAY
jgi:hypothetical protein